jgi:hypothetical protein
VALPTLVSREHLPGEPVRHGGENDQSLGRVGVDSPSIHDQPVPESLSSESLGFGFGRKCSGYAGAALFFRQLTTFADKGYIPSNVHCGTELNHGHQWSLGRVRRPLSYVQRRLDRGLAHYHRRSSSTNPSVPSGKLARGTRVGNRKLARFRIGPAARAFVFFALHRTLDRAKCRQPATLGRRQVSAPEEAFGHHAARLGVTKWLLVWGSMTWTST